MRNPPGHSESTSDILTYKDLKDNNKIRSRDAIKNVLPLNKSWAKRHASFLFPRLLYQEGSIFFRSTWKYRFPLDFLLHYIEINRKWRLDICTETSRDFIWFLFSIGIQRQRNVSLIYKCEKGSIAIVQSGFSLNIYLSLDRTHSNSKLRAFVSATIFTQDARASSTTQIRSVNSKHC